jgi:insertion element IS1 protein InsB
MLTKTITKKAQKTNRFDRFHTTSWPRESRLGRNALTFSKKLDHHLGAIKRFIYVTTY